MGHRTFKRVPLDFDWPLNKVWKGYIEPWDEFHFPECQACGGTGNAPYARFLKDRWYGHVPFKPEENGSTPLTPETPAVRAFAERNVGNPPGFYGSGETAIIREGQRLCDLWNSMWSHHLNQDDVDALVEGDRLWDLTHRFDPEGKGRDRWVATGHHPTPEEVNTWAINSIGHDSINCWLVVEAACKRAGAPYICDQCKGHGDIATQAQRDAAEECEGYEPPEGDGWQLWETTSEGSPTSPVFPTAEMLAEWCAGHATYFADLKMTKDEWLRGFVNDTTDMDSFLVTTAPRYEP